MTRTSERTILTLVFVVFVVVIGAASMTLSPVARLAPLTVACVTLGLLGLELMQSARRTREPSVERERAHDHHERSPVSGRDELAMFAWLLLLLACMSAGGLAVGLPVFLGLFLRFRSRLGWAAALAGAAVLWFVLYGLLDLLLRLRLYEGLWRS